MTESPTADALAAEGFVRACGEADVPEGGKLATEVDDRFVVLVRCEGRVFCLDDMCTHDGGPLGEGRVVGCTIACPRHGAKFDVTTGKALSLPATGATPTHEVRIADGAVFVRIRD